MGRNPGEDLSLLSGAEVKRGRGWKSTESQHPIKEVVHSYLSVCLHVGLRTGDDFLESTRRLSRRRLHDAALCIKLPSAFVISAQAGRAIGNCLYIWEADVWREQIKFNWDTISSLQADVLFIESESVRRVGWREREKEIQTAAWCAATFPRCFWYTVARAKCVTLYLEEWIAHLLTQFRYKMRMLAHRVYLL
jgi:hypothetical protein